MGAFSAASMVDLAEAVLVSVVPGFCAQRVSFFA